VRSCRVGIGQRGRCGYADGTKGDETSGACGTELVGWLVGWLVCWLLVVCNGVIWLRAEFSGFFSELSVVSLQTDTPSVTDTPSLSVRNKNFSRNIL
jgi:hypothetical protein